MMILLLVTAFFYNSQANTLGATLALDDFLTQVESENRGARSSQEIIEGAQLRSHEGDLLTAPSVFSSFQYLRDAKSSPFFPYARLINTSYSLGLADQTSFGTQAKLTYSLNYFSYVGLLPAFYEGRPSLEITQSLWRNALGAETKATAALTNAGALASHFAESFRRKVLLSDSEVLYWQLSSARELVGVSKDALDRATRLYQWSAKRSQLQLVDKSDLYQAEAALELRKLDLQAAEDREKSSARALNHARGRESDRVAENLESINHLNLGGPLGLASIKAPVRAQVRDDVKAAEQSAQATEASATLATSRDTPTLEAYASYAFNSRDPTTGAAFTDSFKTDQPTATVGIRFSASLDFSTLSDSKKGWLKEKSGAELLYQQRHADEINDWAGLTDQLEQAKHHLALAQTIEGIQKKKLDYEKDRYTRGRTTTYQVLLFEQDYAQAQVSRIQFQTEVLGVVAHMRLFK